LISTFALTICSALELFFCDDFACSFRNLIRSAQTADWPQLFSPLHGFRLRKQDHAFADEELARRAENKIEQLELRAISSQSTAHSLRPGVVAHA